jgi:D-3-phosphoglycerate dehydrogenase
MKKNAILLNTARGPIIDLNDLAQALENKTICGAGIDVFESEPLEKDSPLRKLENIVLTPHSAYLSADAREIQREYVTALPLRMLQEKKLYQKNLANPKILDKLSGYELLECL